jgi:hypothetical protein
MHGRLKTVFFPAFPFNVSEKPFSRNCRFSAAPLGPLSWFYIFTPLERRKYNAGGGKRTKQIRNAKEAQIRRLEEFYLQNSNCRQRTFSAQMTMFLSLCSGNTFLVAGRL